MKVIELEDLFGFHFQKMRFLFLLPGSEAKRTLKNFVNYFFFFFFVIILLCFVLFPYSLEIN